MNRKKFTSKRFGLQVLEDQISNILKPVFNGSKKEFVIINNLIKNWSQIIGTKYNIYCYPKIISFDKDNVGKIVIAVYNPAIGFFIEQNSELILERIAKLYGFKSIKKIVIKQEPKDIAVKSNDIKILNPSDKKNIENILKNINNQDLRESLDKLANHIFYKK